MTREDLPGEDSIVGKYAIRRAQWAIGEQKRFCPWKLLRLSNDTWTGRTSRFPRRPRTESSGETAPSSGRYCQIYTDWQQGAGYTELVRRYFLSEKSIQRIVRNMKYEMQ